jgi:hypothetical protein
MAQARRHTMHADAQPLNGHRTAGGLGLSLLGLVGTVSAALAVLLMWTLLTAPTEVAVAVAGGPSELAGVLVRVVIAVVERLLAWL